MERSTHIGTDGVAYAIKRRWDPMHVDAGYAEQEWGLHSTPENELHGTYACSDGSTVTVSHREDGLTGPEFELEWSDGRKVSVIDDSTVMQYLVAAGAATVVPD